MTTEASIIKKGILNQVLNSINQGIIKFGFDATSRDLLVSWMMVLQP